ncbi:MAG: 50S ribosomal protein L25/general stress protein Ctc [Pseudomonadales bacterium]|nr:50S ribosomal protein L25/general stress protein Ctc [Pseudomonadales bacterium]
MSQKLAIHASRRADVGKGASRRLRRSGDVIPAIMYGSQEAAISLTLNVNEINKAMQNESFFSQIIDVQVEGGSQQALVRDVQRNPINGKVLHMDFLRVSADVEIEVHVPIHVIGEEACVGVRLGGGVITHLMTDVEVRCLPADLPEFLEVDVTELELNDLVHLSQLKVPAGVTIIALEHEDDDRAVVSVQPPRVEEAEEELSDEAPEAPPTIGEKDEDGDD